MLLPDVNRVRKVPFGLYQGLFLDIDFSSQTQLFLGLWERETYRVIRRAAPTTEWLVDIGAGAGELCLIFSKWENVRRIIAIEPNPIETRAIRENMIYNKIPSERIEILEQCAGSVRSNEYIRLDQLRIYSSENGFIKIDVDGAELDVLRGGESLLSRCSSCSLLIETHTAELEKRCISFLTALGYTCDVIANAWWRKLIPEQRPIDHNRWLFAKKALITDG